MYKIVRKDVLNEQVSRMVVHAPLVARRAQPGQFIILRVDERGERIPLTIAAYDRDEGTVTIIYQKVGATTRRLDTLDAGDSLTDFVGPLGAPSELEGLRKVAVVGGGLGVAIAYPQAKALHDMGSEVDLIVGFRNESLIILADEFGKACTNLFVMTDDGSNGHKGFVTQALSERLEAGAQYDAVIAIGPLMMMRAVSEMTRPYAIKTIVSMNSIMVDGTGMCGGCRLSVGGETRFACVDGPDFDGHLVDFDAAVMRGRMYLTQEKLAAEQHECRLAGMGG